MRPAWLGMVSLLLALPLASAESAQVDLTASGAIDMTGDVSVDCAPLAVFIADGRALATLVLEAGVLHVHLETKTSLITPDGEVVVHSQPEDATYQDARASLAATSAEAWLGVYQDGSPSFRFVGKQVDARASASPAIGNTQPPETRPDPSRNGFGPELVGLVLEHAGRDGRATIQGDFVAKVYGIDLRVAGSGTPERTFASGAETTGVQRVTRILTIEAKGATLELATPGVVQWASPAADAAIQGTIHGTWQEGGIETGSRSYAPDAGTHHFAGAFVGSLVAAAPGVRVQLSGDLAQADMRSQDAARVAAGPLSSKAFSWILLAGVAVAAGVGHHVARAREGRAELDAAQCVQLAEAAAANEDFETALRWMQLARRKAPTSQRLRLDEAYFHEASGGTDAALDLYRAAVGYSIDGEAEFLLGRLLASRGENGEAASVLALAIRKTPSFALEVGEDPVFGEARAHSPLREALLSAEDG